MAVSKMEKIALITTKDKEEDLLKNLQHVQILELVSSMNELSEEEETLLAKLEFREISSESSKNKAVEKMQGKLHELEESMKILNDFSAAKVKDKLPENVTLAKLEEEVQMEEVDKVICQVKELQKIKESLKKEHENLLKKEELIEKWRYLDVNPLKIEKSTVYCTYSLGNISQLVKLEFENALQNGINVLIEKVYENKTQVDYIIIYLLEDKEEVEQILKKFSFHNLKYSFKEPPQEAYGVIKKRIEENKEAEAQLARQSDKVKKNLPDLQKAEEVLLAKLERELGKEKLADNYADILLLRGWIPEDEEDVLTDIVKKLSTKEAPIIMECSGPDERNKDIPILLKNKRFVKPFEMITEMYSLPKYEEVDPTPLLTPFYLTFFGMMVADAGYGLVMLFGIAFMKKFLRLRNSFRQFLDLFQILSIGIIVWGLIYGSCFGVELPVVPISITNDLNTILIISIAFGFIQVLTGLIINGAQLVKKKEYLESISASFSWIGLLLGALMVVAGVILLDNSILLYAGTIVCVMSAMLVVVIPAIQRTSRIKGLAIGLYNLYGVTGYIGDLVSYTRLMALGIAGGSIAAAFNMLIGFLPTAAKYTVGIVLIIALHALNIFLSLLSAYVHGARLQFVEFFGKFYEGGGRKFTPLGPKEKHIDFVNQNQNRKK